MKRTAGFSGRIVDPINSVARTEMDGLRLAQLARPAYVAMGLTFAMGGTMLLLDRRRAQRLNDDRAPNAWMWTNA